jgi:hypothetical protein
MEDALMQVDFAAVLAVGGYKSAYIRDIGNVPLCRSIHTMI